MSIVSIPTVRVCRKKFTLGPIEVKYLNDECLVVAGDNGAGKTTLFVELVSKLSDEGLVVNFLPQDFSLPTFAKVKNLLGFIATQRGSSVEDIDQVLQVVDLVEFANERIFKLSGGMKRRLGIAVCLLGDPDLILLDEPTASLDITQRRSVVEVLNSIKEHCPLVVSTHLLDDIKLLADRIIFLSKGGKTFDGTINDFMGNSSLEDAYFLHSSRG